MLRGTTAALIAVALVAGACGKTKSDTAGSGRGRTTGTGGSAGEVGDASDGSGGGESDGGSGGTESTGGLGGNAASTGSRGGLGGTDLVGGGGGEAGHAGEGGEVGVAGTAGIGVDGGAGGEAGEAAGGGEGGTGGTAGAGGEADDGEAGGGSGQSGEAGASGRGGSPGNPDDCRPPADYVEVPVADVDANPATYKGQRIMLVAGLRDPFGDNCGGFECLPDECCGYCVWTTIPIAHANILLQSGQLFGVGCYGNLCTVRDNCVPPIEPSRQYQLWGEVNLVEGMYGELITRLKLDGYCLL